MLLYPVVSFEVRVATSGCPLIVNRISGYTDRIVSAGVYLLISDSADIKSTFKYVFVEMRDNCYNGQCSADFPTVGQDKYAVWYASFPLFSFCSN